MTASPTVSVVIPMHDDGAWIGETLRSVHRQTYPLEHIELVAVDDASSDDSASIVARSSATTRCVAR